MPIYYMDTLAGVNFNPTVYVDVSDPIDTKLQLLECHETQAVWIMPKASASARFA